jgi:DNA-directed RNA polymerase specialized sigma24 family protein
MIAVAQWERSAISERTKAALAALRAQGKPTGRPAVVDDGALVDRIRAMKDDELTLRQICDTLNGEACRRCAAPRSGSRQRSRARSATSARASSASPPTSPSRCDDARAHPAREARLLACDGMPAREAARSAGVSVDRVLEVWHDLKDRGVMARPAPTRRRFRIALHRAAELRPDRAADTRPTATSRAGEPGAGLDNRHRRELVDGLEKRAAARARPPSDSNARCVRRGLPGLVDGYTSFLRTALVSDVSREKLLALREALRHYPELRQLMESEGKHVIEAHGIQISLWDLRRGIDALSPRKRQALELNVTRDLKQRDVARIMGISVPTVGQYVLAAIEQLARDYFADA